MGKKIYLNDFNEEYVKREMRGERNIDIIVKAECSNGEIIERLRNILINNYSRTIKVWRCKK
ncbi:MAG: hypothetical protein DRJ34_01570 [Thermoprotei archaeon]|nr:MAG: hypothetical protein DRJ34_01570 [Thermoprotei archaeon]RLE71073.1 MAG: hypothetical protein DRJ45_04270 [Thermoprotei archaeon]